MSEPAPHRLEAALREGFLRYYETTYWLRDPRLRDERRALLVKPGVVFTEPLIEPVPPLRGDRADRRRLRAGRLSTRVAERLARVVFGQGPDFRLRAHQAEALPRLAAAPATARQRNVVVTSGTGSGKTESFLLPLFARLLAEV